MDGQGREVGWLYGISLNQDILMLVWYYRLNYEHIHDLMNRYLM